MERQRQRTFWAERGILKVPLSAVGGGGGGAATKNRLSQSVGFCLGKDQRMT